MDLNHMVEVIKQGFQTYACEIDFQVLLEELIEEYDEPELLTILLDTAFIYQLTFKDQEILYRVDVFVENLMFEWTGNITTYKDGDLLEVIPYHYPIPESHWDDEEED